MYQHALIVGKFAPLHRGHQLLIETALEQSRRVTVLCYATPDFTCMPNEMRAGWVRRLYPQVDVRIPLGAPPDAADDADHRLFVKRYLLDAGMQPDVVFSAAAYGPGFAEVIKTAHVNVDNARFPVSGSAIRQYLQNHRTFLDPLVLEEIDGVADLNRRR